jgi:hypothetical protein
MYGSVFLCWVSMVRNRVWIDFTQPSVNHTVKKRKNKAIFNIEKIEMKLKGFAGNKGVQNKSKP